MNAVTCLHLHTFRGVSDMLHVAQSSRFSHDLQQLLHTCFRTPAVYPNSCVSIAMCVRQTSSLFIFFTQIFGLVTLSSSRYYFCYTTEWFCCCRSMLYFTFTSTACSGMKNKINICTIYDAFNYTDNCYMQAYSNVPEIFREINKA